MNHRGNEDRLLRGRKQRGGSLSIVACLLLTACCGCSRGPLPATVRSSQPVSSPGAPLKVRITGHEFRWQIRYAGADEEFDTEDDVRTRRHLHLPPDSPVTLELGSDDFVYSLYIPHVEIFEFAYPGRIFILEFDSGLPSTHELLGTQMCGFAHPELIGELVVHVQDEFDEWLDANL